MDVDVPAHRRTGTDQDSRNRLFRSPVGTVLRRQWRSCNRMLLQRSWPWSYKQTKLPPLLRKQSSPTFVITRMGCSVKP